MPAIRFRNVTKTYHIQTRATPRMGAWLVNKFFEHLRRVPFDALHDVSFDIPRGQLAGFLGSNGAGKSTVLKLVSGISQPTGGSVSVSGRIASMLELGIGFHPDLSGMENIFYSGIILGMTRAVVLERLEKIVEFSGLRDHLYEPVKHYSSGMYARLATSVALHLDPEIVLIDEILAVGDAEFNLRAFGRLLELHAKGVTIVIVTHDIGTARAICDRLIWLEHGRIVADGPSADVARDYLAKVRHQSLPPYHPCVLPCATGLGEPPVFSSVHLEDAAGRRTDSPETGKLADIVVEVEDAGSVPYRVWIGVRSPDGRRLFEDTSPAVAPGTRRVVYRVDPWTLYRGEQYLSVAILPAEHAGHSLDLRRDALLVRTVSDASLHIPNCLTSPPVEWTVR